MGNPPDRGTRLLSHAIVSLAVGYAIARASGPVPGVVAGVIAAVAHEELDAPFAQLLADNGL